MPQAMMIPDAKAAVDEEWKKFEKLPAWQLDNVSSKKRKLLLEAQRDNKKVHFGTLMDICHLKKCGVGTEVPIIQRTSRAPR